MSLTVAPCRLLAALRASFCEAKPTIADALRDLWMAVMEYFHARPETKIPEHILTVVKAMQDSAKNAPAMQSLTLMSALQSLSSDEIAGDPGVAKALAAARAALVSQTSLTAS